MGHAMMAQVTMVITELPNGSEEDTIYISGNFEEWSGGSEKYQLKKLNDNFTITLDESQPVIEFKFTKGSWDSVELNADGSNKENRTYSFEKKKDTLKISIEKWSDDADPISTAMSNVSVLADGFYMPELNKNRKVWIYLPLSYENSSKKYPVIYMHDGQNLFDDELAYSGEWGVDETLNRLSKEKKLEFIVIGIENGGADRISEYAPWGLPKYNAKAQGDAYINFIIETLKPYVDREYRTLSDRNNTAIMGSSLGGIISYYAAIKHPEIFGKSGVFSPSFSLFPTCFDFTEKHARIENSKMYMMAGDQESDNMVNDMNIMIETMSNTGFPETNIKSRVVIGGKHNESLWKSEFMDAITWLFQ
jgi:alpha-glucosidase